MGTNPGPSAPVVDEATERNTALLRKCHEDGVLQENRQACREYGIGVGKDELRRLQKFVSQAIIKLLNRYNITQGNGNPYVSSCPKGFLQGPDAWLSKKGYRISGWPRGLPYGSISTWPTPFTFSLALMFINGTIDLKPVGSCARTTDNDQNSSGMRKTIKNEATESPVLSTTGYPLSTLELGSACGYNSHGSTVPSSKADIDFAGSIASPESEDRTFVAHDFDNDQQDIGRATPTYPENTASVTPRFYPAIKQEANSDPHTFVPTLLDPNDASEREKPDHYYVPFREAIQHKYTPSTYKPEAYSTSERHFKHVATRRSHFDATQHGRSDWPRALALPNTAVYSTSSFSSFDDCTRHDLSNRKPEVAMLLNDARSYPAAKGPVASSHSIPGHALSTAGLRMPESNYLIYPPIHSSNAQYVEPLASSFTQNSLHLTGCKSSYKRKELEPDYPGVPIGATINWIPPTSATRSEMKKRKSYAL